MNMKHLMSGGAIREKRFYDFAKVKLENGQVAFYISEIFNLAEGDSVIVPYANEPRIRGVVLRVDRNVSEQVAPVPVKRAKKIIQKV